MSIHCTSVFQLKIMNISRQWTLVTRSPSSIRRSKSGSRCHHFAPASFCEKLSAVNRGQSLVFLSLKLVRQRPFRDGYLFHGGQDRRAIGFVRREFEVG